MRDSANVYLYKSFQLLNELNNRKLLAQTWYLKGKVGISVLDYDDAMNSFIEADKIFKAEGMRKEHGLAEMQFGVLMYAQNNFKASIGFFGTACQILTQTKDTFNYLTCNYLLGLAYLETGKFDKAENTLNSTLAQVMEMGFTQREMECRLGLAKLFLKNRAFAKAISTVEIPLAYSRSVEVENSGNQGATARAEYIYGMAALGLKDYFLADKMLNLSLQHLQANSNYTERIKTSEALIELYKETKNYDGAFKQMVQILELKDSLAEVESDKTLSIFKDRQNMQIQSSKIELLTIQQENDKIVKFSLIVLAVLLLIISVTWYQKFRLRRETNRKLDELLLNILPVEVAEELKLSGNASPKSYSSVSVLFVDMVAFTKLSEKLSPDALVAELHACFSAFDEISSRHHLEKIKTLGDAYMCAGGVPVANDTHAFDAIYASREIIEFISHYNSNKPDELKIQLRIGIHTGPVVAGVVGIKKFAYDIWGDTVNIAARLEQAGEPGRINISENTYQLVKDKIRCSSRGKINAKYKG
ncbi:MAG: adenylate/guanylate cyclase domain-containing protein, partial [Bacteroidia bacterium]